MVVGAEDGLVEGLSGGRLGFVDGREENLLKAAKRFLLLDVVYIIELWVAWGYVGVLLCPR